MKFRDYRGSARKIGAILKAAASAAEAAGNPNQENFFGAQPDARAFLHEIIGLFAQANQHFQTLEELAQEHHLADVKEVYDLLDRVDPDQFLSAWREINQSELEAGKR